MMIDTKSFTVGELAKIFADNSDERLIADVIAAAKNGIDNRKALLTLVRRFERQTAEKERVGAPVTP